MGWDEIIVFVGYWMYVEPEEDPEAPFDGTTGSVDGISTDYLVYAVNNLDQDPEVYADAVARIIAGYIRGKAVGKIKADVGPCGGYAELVATLLYGHRFMDLVLSDWFRSPVGLVEELLFHSPLTRVEVDMTVERDKVWPAHILISIPRDDEFTWVVADYEGVEGSGRLRDELEKALAKHGILKALQGPEGALGG